MAVFAIFLQFVLTGNLLATFGIDVNIRVHPASMIVLLCAIYAMLSGVVPFHQRCRDAPGLMLFVFGIPMLAMYAAFFNGFSGTAFYFDSFWSPALLALLLEPATDKQKRLLAKILMTFILANCLVGLIESVTEHNWFPFLPSDPKLAAMAIKAEGDFRANAFYSHPLTASLITAMGVFLLYSMRIRFIGSALILGVLLVGLLEFGGRAALGVTLIVSALAAFYVLMTGILRRNLKLDFVLAIVSAAIILPILITVIVTQTTIADRIIDSLFHDDAGSASVRTQQWVVLNFLTLKNWLFGVPMVELEHLRYQIGLSDVEDIENFWLLIFLDLGLIGFGAFVCLFGGFLVHVTRFAGGMNAWLLMFSALVIDSSSNSLGQKSNDLFIEVAALIAMAGYKNYVREPRVRRFRHRLEIRRLHDGLAQSPPIHGRGDDLRGLRS
ncbi:VpsF family polysaccharide biosynthesis protein [Rhodopila sp.]|uniref:VpsF family polysaccharide biosynthesis protein n=1 Tax=Rhodopila sp. TaxID=2480087 RepID=UPI003D0C5714